MGENEESGASAMELGRVVGTVVSTIKAPGLNSFKLLLVSPFGGDEAPSIAKAAFRRDRSGRRGRGRNRARYFGQRRAGRARQPRPRRRTPRSSPWSTPSGSETARSTTKGDSRMARDPSRTAIETPTQPSSKGDRYGRHSGMGRPEARWG